MTSEPSMSQGNRSDAAVADMTFCATADSSRNLITILNALHHPSKKKKQFVNLTPTSRGIDLVWEDAKTLQGHVFLCKELFQQYRARELHPTIKVSLSDLLEVLQILPCQSNGGPKLLLGQKLGGNSLCLMTREGDVSTDVGLVVAVPDPIRLFEFRNSGAINDVIVQSSTLHEALSELDWSSNTVSVLLSPEAPYFRISTSGPSGSAQQDYPKDSEVFSEFKCTHTLTGDYTLRRLAPAIRAMQYALRTRIRMNQEGMLAMAHMIKHEDSAKELMAPDGTPLSIFVEFFILSNDAAAGDDE